MARGERGFGTAPLGKDRKGDVPPQSSFMEGQGPVLGLDYHVDLKLNLDVTKSMVPFIAQAKERLINFYGLLAREFDKTGQKIPHIRVKVCAYRDFYYDGTTPDKPWPPYVESPFYSLPDEEAEFKDFVNGLTAEGGGDEPESGLEALALSLRGEWTREGHKQRHVIVFFTDAPAHPLPGDNPKWQQEELPNTYPKGLPQTFAELKKEWYEQLTNTPSLRLLLLAPDAYPWPDLKATLDNCNHHESQAGDGLKEIVPDAMIDLIRQTMGN